MNEPTSFLFGLTEFEDARGHPDRLRCPGACLGDRDSGRLSWCGGSP